MPNMTTSSEVQLVEPSAVLERDAALNGGASSSPTVSIILPTKNEQGNIPALFAQIEQALGGSDIEVIVVDDSDDKTAEIASEAGERMPYSVRVIRRDENERRGGLSSAVVAGTRSARGRWVCVMDADLQHPPEVVGELLDRAESDDADLVVASRYCSNGSSSGFGHVRAFVSRAVTRSACLLFPRRLQGITDPMSGFFLFRRESVDLDRLQPQGFKILLEILATHQSLRRDEVPFQFGTRNAGDSKASMRQGTIYLSQLVRLRLGSRGFNLLRFCVVGGVGLGVNMGAFILFNSVFGLNYLLAAVIATQASTLVNFLLTEHWVFAQRATGRAHPRALMYFALNNASLLLRAPILIVFVSFLGIGSTLANFLSLVALTIIRFGVADSFIWRPRASGPHAYDIHGLVRVVSDVVLPELEFFRTEELPVRPSVRVRIGHLSRRQSDLVQALLSPAVLWPRHVRYDEGLGPLGFSVELSAGLSFEIVAAPLLRLSPHVLYTNVVEPVLRWMFVTKGYALVHGACISADGEATLITAKTDTGKTTTILKALDARSYEFLSDDLTLLNEEGEILCYPKPLTISRHTLRAVSTPLLRMGERARLVYQSRLHSRSGRRFAMLIAKLRLPAATINAVVQLLVPPPKYHIQRLVPDVSLALRARLRKLYVIERGDERRQYQLEQNTAAETLLANSEDAFGFPPYPALARFLTQYNGHDLAAAERDIVSQALQTIPACVLRSDSMDWWKHFVEEPSTPVDLAAGVSTNDEVAAAAEPGGGA